MLQKKNQKTKPKISELYLHNMYLLFKKKKEKNIDKFSKNERIIFVLFGEKIGLLQKLSSINKLIQKKTILFIFRNIASVF